MLLNTQVVYERLPQFSLLTLTNHSTSGGLCCAHELERGDCDCVNTFKQIGERGATLAWRPANPNPTRALAKTMPIGLGSDKLMAAALEQDPMGDSVEGDLADAVDVLSVSNGGGVKSKNISG